MFPKGLGNLGDMAGMLKKAVQLKQGVEELKEQLANETTEGSAGGGMVKITINGKFELLSVSIEKDVIDPNESEMLETLICAAVNEGARKMQEVVKGKMSEITGGLDIPGLT